MFSREATKRAFPAILLALIGIVVVAFAHLVIWPAIQRHRAVVNLLGTLPVQELRSVDDAISEVKSKGAVDAAARALIVQISSADSDVQSSAAFVLGELGPEAHEAVPSLVSALDSENILVAYHAGVALAYIDPRAAPDAAVGAITRLLKDDIHGRHWIDAGEALKRIDPKAAERIRYK